MTSSLSDRLSTSFQSKLLWIRSNLCWMKTGLSLLLAIFWLESEAKNNKKTKYLWTFTKRWSLFLLLIGMIFIPTIVIRKSILSIRSSRGWKEKPLKCLYKWVNLSIWVISKRCRDTICIFKRIKWTPLRTSSRSALKRWLVFSTILG